LGCAFLANWDIQQFDAAAIGRGGFGPWFLLIPESVIGFGSAKAE
jgi:hypothetical protein